MNDSTSSQSPPSLPGNLRTPRARRLETDWRLLQQLANESTAFQFAVGHRGEEGMPESYHLTFHGPSLVSLGDAVPLAITIQQRHEVRVVLGPQYPRQVPLLTWLSPIFHPNIAPSGTVCMGGYSSHWVPSLMLDRLCEMLWDMLTFRNYNVESPYHRKVAQWLSTQKEYVFPLEARALRQVSRSQASEKNEGSPKSEGL